jgi:hypothetical protein
MSWAVGGRTGLILAWFAVLSLVLTLPSAAPGVAPKRACFGKQATKVGTKHGNRIVAKADAVVWAGGGNDTIRVVPPDHTTHVICGGPGDDEVRGGSERDVLVGDKANPNGDSSKGTASDYLVGGLGADFVVGDNYASGSASGAKPDRRLLGNASHDTLIGDSAATASGKASGGAKDLLEGADGADLVVGDSYSRRGVARGGGNDEVNGGPGTDLQVGDSYTDNGRASGGGHDRLHSPDGAAGTRCTPHACADAFYGDSYAASCGLRWVVCRHTSGGGFDLLTTGPGNDFLNGGPPNNPEARRKRRDRCAGGSGFDIGTRCEYVDRDVEQPDVEPVAGARAIPSPPLCRRSCPASSGWRGT